MPGCCEIPKRPSARHRYVQRRAGRVWYLPWLSRNLAPGKSLDAWVFSPAKSHTTRRSRFLTTKCPLWIHRACPIARDSPTRTLKRCASPTIDRLPGLAHARRQSQPCQRRCTQPMMLHRHPSLTCRHPPRAMATQTSFKRRLTRRWRIAARPGQRRILRARMESAMRGHHLA